ncbi:MAG: DUF4251 domain-containing protein [Prevotella sp.]|nr:DUF4251 domain-containing protein [Prevotella sp.]
MKIFVSLIGALLVMLTACSSLSQGEKAQRRQELAANVVKALDNRHFNIEVNRMVPLRGMTRQLEYGYNLQLKGDTLSSYLPFFGRAYNVPFGGGKALNFNALVKGYEVKRSGKDKSVVRIDVFNGEENLIYTLDVFDNAQVSINVVAQERDVMNYTGELVFQDKK